MRFSDRFKRFLRLYPKPDGAEWTPADLERATGGFVNLSYVSSLRSGRIRNPGTDKLKAIADTMGFPWELWYEQPEDWAKITQNKGDTKATLAERLNHLFDVLENFRTSSPYTSEEVARLSRGELTTEGVEAIRTGMDQNPSMSQLLALSDVFGVDPAYWFSGSPRSTPLDPVAMQALQDPDAELILQKTLSVPKKDRGMLLGLIDRLSRGRNEEGKG